MRRIFLRLSLSLAALSCLLAPVCRAQENMPVIEIGMLSVTHVLFTSDLTYVNLASPNTIRAKVVESSKNMLAIQAVSEFPFTTTISALEANGTMHTFYVRYNASPASLLIDTRTQMSTGAASVNTQIRPEAQQPQARQQGAVGAAGAAASAGSAGSQGPVGSVSRAGNHSRAGAPQSQRSGNGVNVTSAETSNFGRGNAPTIEEVMRKPRSLYHITDKCFGMEADCINIYTYSDVLYIVISLTNKSDIGYDAGDAQFTVETKKLTSKTLQSDKPVWPKSSYGKLACAPNAMTKIGYTIPKLTLQKNEVMKIYIYEKDGTRNLFLTLDAKDINYAVSPLGK